MSLAKQSRSVNYNLEALRGVAALVVVWHHIIVHSFELDPFYKPSGVAAYNPPGHFAVLIFFLLSGYVMGIRYAQPLQQQEVGEYLRRRVVRLYPMYALALLAGVLVSAFTIPLTTILQHLLFLQNWGADIIYENNPLWSLQYEILFYLAFIPLSLFRVRPLVALLASTSTGLALLGLGKLGAAQYFFGFSFWALGWALARLPDERKSVAWTSVISSLLLLLSVEYLNPLTTALQKLIAWAQARELVDTTRWTIYIINIYDYAALPYAASIVLLVSGATGRLVRWGSLTLQLLPLVGVAYAIRHWREPSAMELALPCLFYLLSTALFFAPAQAFTSSCRWAVNKLIWLGAISYGLYVIHFPILTLFHRLHVFAGTPASFAIRAVLYLLLSIGAAYLLDKVYQPWARRKIESL